MAFYICIYICIYVYTFTHILHCLNERHFNKLLVYCNLLHIHFHFVKFRFGTLLCLTIAVMQCGRYTVIIACFTAGILVNINILSYVHCNLTFKLKKY